MKCPSSAAGKRNFRLNGLFLALVLLLTTLWFSPSVLAREPDLKSFRRIESAEAYFGEIKKDATVESEIIKWFGKEDLLFDGEKAASKEGEAEFAALLRKYIDPKMNPQYPFPSTNQKVLFYIIAWTFEHPARTGDCKTIKGECEITKNLVIPITINKQNGIVAEYAGFGFWSEREWKGSKA